MSGDLSVADIERIVFCLSISLSTLNIQELSNSCVQLTKNKMSLDTAFPIKLQVSSALSENLDQPAHPSFLFRVGSQEFKASSGGQRRL